MEQEKRVIDFYVLCNKLKDVIRTGWKDWGVDRERVESVAEHIYGTQMLALAMWSEYKYDLDISKVMFMLAVHELEETIIGDLTLFQITKEDKDKLGHEAIQQILSGLLCGEDVKALILEFDKRETAEARFAYQCDKLECDIQCKLYDEHGCVDLEGQKEKAISRRPEVKELIDSGKSWSDMWLMFGQRRYNYDKNFKSVSDYAMANKITKKGN